MSYEERSLKGLSQDQGIHDLDHRFLVSTRCSACKKIIASKQNLSKEESANKIIFNEKHLLFSCKNFSAVKDTSHIFCMCYHFYPFVTLGLVDHPSISYLVVY